MKETRCFKKVLWMIGLFLLLDGVAWAALHTSSDCENVTKKGKIYKCVYKVWADKVSGICGTGGCPANHYCPDRVYPNIIVSGRGIYKGSRCKDNACGKGECTPRCGWPDVDGCDEGLVHTCASGETAYWPNNGLAYCLKPCKTCANFSGQCGTFTDDVCSRSITCGCASGLVCSSGTCIAPSAIPYVKIMKVNCPGTVPTEEDIAGYLEGAGPSGETSPVKIGARGGVYDISLVSEGTSDASCVHVAVTNASGVLETKAFRKCGSNCS